MITNKKGYITNKNFILDLPLLNYFLKSLLIIHVQLFNMVILVGTTGKVRTIRFQGYQECGGDSTLSMHSGIIQSKKKIKISLLWMLADIDNFSGKTCNFTSDL